jgi:hypothetical protein
VNENSYTKMYMPKVDYSGDRCVYETEVGNDVIFKNGSVYSIPPILNDDDVCPILSPENCKDPTTTFLKKFVNDAEAPMKCMECPEGSYRSDNMRTTNESIACLPNADCIELNECDNILCESCLTNVETSVNGDKYEIVYIEKIPDRDQCVPIDDSHCEKKPDGSYDICKKPVITDNNGKRFCDNCSPGYALKFDSGNLSCTRIVECDYLPNTLCYNNTSTFFDMYKYENETDDFSECVWKPVSEIGDNLTECITQCPVGTYRTNDTRDTTITYDDKDFCIEAQQIF